MTKHIASAVVALTGLAAVATVGASAYGAEQTPRNPGVQQADKSPEECIARRQREGLSIRHPPSRTPKGRVMIVAKRWVRDAVDVAMPSRVLCAWTNAARFPLARVSN